MATNKKDLKAFVRYDGTGRIIPGSLILQRSKPKVGNWQQTTAYECCDPQCPTVVYGTDYIIQDIVPYGVDSVDIIVILNPFEQVAVQAAIFNCNGSLINISPVLDTALPGTNDWIVPLADLLESCTIKFRRVCFNGRGHSEWKEANLLSLS